MSYYTDKDRDMGASSEAEWYCSLYREENKAKKKSRRKEKIGSTKKPRRNHANNKIQKNQK